MRALLYVLKTIKKKILVLVKLSLHYGPHAVHFDLKLARPVKLLMINV